MAHIKGRSFGFGGKEVLLPSIDPKTGRSMSDDEIVGRFRKGTLKAIGTFKSPQAATKFSKKLSKGFNPRAKNPSAQGRKPLSDNPTK